MNGKAFDPALPLDASGGILPTLRNRNSAVYQEIWIMIMTSQNRMQLWAGLCNFLVLIEVEVSKCHQHFALLPLQKLHTPVGIETL